MKRSRLQSDPDLDASKLGSSLGGTDPALDDTVADVDVDEALTGADADALEDEDPRHVAYDEDDPGFDPEAGRGSIANKTSISGAVLNESGLFILGAIAALAGLTSVIFAVFMQSRPYIIAAIVIAPPAFIWFILRWRKWLGRAPYLYRLLSSLGEREDAEDVLEQHVQKKEAKIRNKIAKLEAQQATAREG
ncbi:MAG: hypothetical protein AAGI53_07960 [Planctomycetota bacterium]